MMELIEFITENFWMLLYLVIMCVANTPGLACFMLAIYLSYGRIPGWLYVVAAIISASIHLSKITETLKLNNSNQQKYNVHIHYSDTKPNKGE